MLMLQWTVLHPYTHREHQVDLVSFKIYTYPGRKSGGKGFDESTLNSCMNFSNKKKINMVINHVTTIAQGPGMKK